MRTYAGILALVAVMSLAGAGCRSVPGHQRAGLSATQIRQGIVGTWTRVGSLPGEPPTTLTFASDGRLEWQSEGVMVRRAYWRAEDLAVDTLRVTEEKSDIGGPSNCWTIWHLDGHSLVMFTGGLSAAGAPERYRR